MQDNQPLDDFSEKESSTSLFRIIRIAGIVIFVGSILLHYFLGIDRNIFRIIQTFGLVIYFSGWFLQGNRNPLKIGLFLIGAIGFLLPRIIYTDLLPQKETIVISCCLMIAAYLIPDKKN